MYFIDLSVGRHKDLDQNCPAGASFHLEYQSFKYKKDCRHKP